MSERRQHKRQRNAIGDDDDDDDGNGQGRQQRQPSQSANQRRRQAAISLASFSTKKGHDRALQEYKKRKETKFQKNAKLLREYEKVMKQEGYDAGRGASRKRSDRQQGKDDDGDERPADGRGAKSTTEQGESNEYTTSEQSRKKRHKSDPLHNAKKEAERRRAEQLEAMSQKEQRQQQEKKKLKDRKVRAKKMMQRTKRGQPLIKNVIGDLLAKIKSDVGDDGSK
ncbi:hypothetical protein ACHAWU_006611 [Discostella pseudostelligera]|uniref:rRNA-processing protein FYV7 n=1 Tax=Discostella pseudostelligera TaxID=259834 RepID=A0ABD3M8J3_9STRA